MMSLEEGQSLAFLENCLTLLRLAPWLWPSVAAFQADTLVVLCSRHSSPAHPLLEKNSSKDNMPLHSGDLGKQDMLPCRNQH